MKNVKLKKETLSVVPASNQSVGSKSNALEPSPPLIDTPGTRSQAPWDDTAEDSTTCAVQGCTLSTSRPNNLCNKHRLPGVVVRVNNSTMVITVWAAEHGDEVGIILLNDFALGDLFDGREGFEARLAERGFSKVRNISTEQELDAARHPTHGKRVGAWGGPWRTEYPWEVTAEAPQPKSRKR